jgi:hypothetical protein
MYKAVGFTFKPGEECSLWYGNKEIVRGNEEILRIFLDLEWKVDRKIAPYIEDEYDVEELMSMLSKAILTDGHCLTPDTEEDGD